MSAEPARTGPETGGVEHAATVFAFRRPRRREAAVPQPPDPNRPGLTPEQKLAATVEAAFAEHHRTLTDPATAEAFTISVSLMRTVIAGALAQGLIDQAAHDDLTGMLTGMQQAPGLLA